MRERTWRVLTLRSLKHHYPMLTLTGLTSSHRSRYDQEAQARDEQQGDKADVYQESLTTRTASFTMSNPSSTSRRGSRQKRRCHLYELPSMLSNVAFRRRTTD